jgi:hypothetical protein
VNASVISNAIGGLTDLLGKSKDALIQIEAEEYGYFTTIRYEDARAALGFYLDALGVELLVVLEAAKMPQTRISVDTAWAEFKNKPRGLYQIILDRAFESARNDAVTYAERLIAALRMCVSKELTTEESWTLRRLEAILNDTDALVYNRIGAPKNEHQLEEVMHDYLKVCFPDFDSDPKISGSIKGFEPDCGIRSVRAAIEFKIVHDRKQVATAFSGVVEDTAAYKGSKDWTRFYAVYYQAQPFMLRSHVDEDMKRIGAIEWKTIIVNGPTNRVKKKARSKIVRRKLPL